MPGGEFASFFLGSFFSLVTIINPPSALPLFTVLSGGLTADGQRALARRACLYAFMILVVSLFAGGLIMNLFGVSSAALRVAGGICVLLLGHGMLFGRGGIDAGAHDTHTNPAFFPLALPSITGPGTIAVVIGISTEIRELKGLPAELGAYAGTLAAMVATCVLTWVVLRGARVISKRLGANGIEVLTRLMGFLLLCIGVQFIASGVRSFVGGS
ncbi:MAG TPA: MarC family NAAT transporter [Quisquiliibacterium sp.]|nr:MarC family NAAT transporter [Quisquiliibacterium sp.]